MIVITASSCSRQKPENKLRIQFVLRFSSSAALLQRPVYSVLSFAKISDHLQQNFL